MLNEIITTGGIDYSVQNISTGLNTISFVVQEMTVDEAESVFKNVTALFVKSESGEVYGEYPHRRELKTKALVKLLYGTLRFD